MNMTQKQSNFTIKWYKTINRSLQTRQHDALVEVEKQRSLRPAGLFLIKI